MSGKDEVGVNKIRMILCSGRSGVRIQAKRSGR